MSNDRKKPAVKKVAISEVGGMRVSMFQENEYFKEKVAELAWGRFSGPRISLQRTDDPTKIRVIKAVLETCMEEGINVEIYGDLGAQGAYQYLIAAGVLGMVRHADRVKYVEKAGAVFDPAHELVRLIMEVYPGECDKEATD